MQKTVTVRMTKQMRFQLLSEVVNAIVCMCVCVYVCIAHHLVVIRFDNVKKRVLLQRQRPAAAASAA